MNDIEKILKGILIRDRNRKKSIPTEKIAIRVMSQAYTRLTELGFDNAIYCPKDGSIFDALDASSNRVYKCSYKGEWPSGSWWHHSEDGDLYPARPALYRCEKNTDNIKSLSEFLKEMKK
jgi:hypothetical protein